MWTGGRYSEVVVGSGLTVLPKRLKLMWMSQLDFNEIRQSIQ